MHDPAKTNQELIEENTLLKQRIQELEYSETKRKQMGEALEAQQRSYRALAANLPGIVYRVLIREKNRMQFFNNMLVTLTGYNEEELNEGEVCSIDPLIIAKDRDRIIAEVNSAIEHNLAFSVEYRIIHKDGTLRFFSERGRPVFDNDKLRSIDGIILDITEQKRSEMDLRDSEEKYRRLAEDIPAFISTFLPDGTLTYANNALASWDGITPDEMVGQNLFSFLSTDEREKIKIHLDLLTPEQPVETHEQWYWKTGGRETFHQWTNRGFFDAQGRLTHLHGIGFDITDRKKMDAELLRAHKLESLGVLAGGIAHDFNNLMSVVQGYIDLALMDLPPDHVSCQRLLTAMQYVEQTRDLTSRLITFSRGGGLIKKISDIADIIRDAVYRTVNGTQVKVKFDFMENLWPAEVDDLQLKQCFYNLTTNAMEAMPEGGNLTIKLENTRVTAGEVPELKDGTYLKITITDEGIGIPEENRQKAFDPYFTTKKIAAQKGLGLGLAVCYSVLKKHDGHITVKSQLGKGSSFVLYLPAQAELVKGKEIKKTMSAGKFRVLIMDDEPHIRAINRAYLERFGYEVTEVKDGQEALDTYQKAFDSFNPFSLVILDLTVRQGMGGHMAMGELLKIDPSIRAIIVSGYVDDPVIENYGSYGFLGALTKPFKGEELKNLVEKILLG